MLLAGRVVLVTGGSRGLGGAMVKAFAREGALVAFNYASSDADASATAAAVEAAGGLARAYKCSVIDRAGLRVMVKQIGPLNWILSLSELHRWHHARERAFADANYGGVLLVWDVVFGTRVGPRDREPPADPGLTGHPGYPTGYLAQLASPFRADLWDRR